MKLRINRNSVRIRIDQEDLKTLISETCIEQSLAFGDDPLLRLTYSIKIDSGITGPPQVDYHAGRIQVRLSPQDAEEWNSTDRIGFDNEQTFGANTVRLLLEKDFACLDRPQARAEEDQHAFLNPKQTC